MDHRFLRRMGRWAALGTAGLASLAGIGAGVGYLWLRTSLPTLDGEVAAGGIGGPVEIVRDDRGVPHVFAASLADAMAGLGFVHAQDRLFQMDVQRRTAAGRLAELAGERGVPFDRRFRVLGLERAARSSWEALDGETRALYEAYAAGVNAFLAGHEGAWPLEYELLRVEPAPWRPLDSILVLGAMSLLLATNLDSELLRLRLAALLPPEAIAELLPTASGEGPLPLDPFPIVPRTAPLGGGSEPGASNAWVIAGTRTATGKPILANDPHLGLGLPGTWYLVHLEAPGARLIGASLPGLPGIVLGHNGRVAWGFTNTYADTQDLFIERLDPKNPERVAAPGGTWDGLRTREERIVVKGGEDVVVAVRESRHGPIVSDVDPELAALIGPDHVAALAWAALAPGDTTPRVAAGLADVTSVAGFLDLVRDYRGPVQNMVVADGDGAIGVIAPGRLPLRQGRDGRVPAPGWSGEGDWVGTVPPDATPRIVEPASGYLVTANAKWVPAGYPYLVTHDWAPAYRARRIAAMIEATPKASVQDVRAMQGDLVSLAARDLLPFLAAAEPASDAGRAARDLLAGWDGVMAPDRPEPLVFSAWLLEATRRLLGDDLGPELAAEWASRPEFLAATLAGGTPGWCDDRRTTLIETCTDLVAAALDSSVADLAGRYGDDPRRWRWDAAHRARHAHPVLGRLPVIGDLFAVTQPIGGDRFSVNVSSLAGDGEDPYLSRFGAGLRAIYDLADLDRSLFVVAVGQSGNPFSEHYADLAEAWLANEPFTIPAVRPSGPGTHALRLVPAP